MNDSSLSPLFQQVKVERTSESFGVLGPRVEDPMSDLDSLSKNPIPGCSKRSRCKAREKSTSAGVFTDTLERGDRAQRSRWAFFNSLLKNDPALAQKELRYAVD